MITEKFIFTLNVFFSKYTMQWLEYNALYISQNSNVATTNSSLLQLINSSPEKVASNLELLWVSLPSSRLHQTLHHLSSPPPKSRKEPENSGFSQFRQFGDYSNPQSWKSLISFVNYDLLPLPCLTQTLLGCAKHFS